MEGFGKFKGSLLVCVIALALPLTNGCGTAASIGTTTSSGTTTSTAVAPSSSTVVASSHRPRRNPVVTVQVTPSIVTLAASQSQAFTATVGGTANSSVTWFVNAIAGGNSSLGTISGSGMYTAPQSPPASSVSIIAVSVVDATQSATATVNLSPATPPPPAIRVTVAPLAVTLAAGQSQTFDAVVSGSSNTQVNWLVNGIPSGTSALGIITSSGVYTAPATVPASAVSISATSVADPTKTASAVVSFSSSAPTANYYVSPSGSDASDGSAQHPWLTLQHAAAVVQAGAMVHVAPGAYSGAITTTTSGTAAARIRFVSDQQWGAMIRAGSVDIIWTNLGDYVDIEGFDIAGNTADTCNGIINYASYVRIVGNQVHDVGHDSVTCVYGSGIVNHQNRAGHDDDVIGNVVHDIGDFSKANALQHGIYHGNLRGHIWNNLVYRCQGWGIHMWHAANQVTVANNTVFNNAYGGILIGDGDDPGGFTAPVINDYTLVSNNIVYRNGLQPGGNGYGIEEYGNTGPHNQYLNNLVYQNRPSDWKLQNGISPLASLSADPQFVSYQPDGSGDYHLGSTSPARGTGTASGAPVNDLTGAARSAASMDIGAYAWNVPPAVWPFD